MKKTKLSGALLISLMAASLASCGGSGSSKLKIGVGLYTDVGVSYTSTVAFLNGVAEAANCEFVYKTIDGKGDATKNLQYGKELISAGCQGIIWTMDSATEAILEQCKKANVYMAGYLCDFENSYDTVKTNPNFLGTVCDGRYEGTAWGQEIAQRVINEGKKRVGLVSFPFWSFPHQEEMANGFKAKIDEHNATLTEAEKIKYTEVEQCMFSPISSTWLADSATALGGQLDAIFGMCAGIDNIYPVVKEAGLADSLSLYTAGFDVTPTVRNNFGTNGDQCFQELVYASAETVAYPLVKLINKLTNKTFSDEPTVAQRVESGQIITRNNEQYSKAADHHIYATARMSDSLISVDDFSALLAKNGGTEAKLQQAMADVDTAHLMAK